MNLLNLLLQNSHKKREAVFEKKFAETPT